MIDKFVQIFVYLSLSCTVLEALAHSLLTESDYWYYAGYVFLLSYILCIATELGGIKDLALVRSDWFRQLMSVCHALDGVAATVVGLGMYYRSPLLLLTGTIVLTKFCLLHIMNRMILAHKKPNNIFESMYYTTKSFLHHLSSFLFLSQHEEIIFTTIWRTLSMTAHASLVLRGKMLDEHLATLTVILGYIRIVFMCMLLFILVLVELPSYLLNPLSILPIALQNYVLELHNQFSGSAMGHISYLVIRLGPVYKTGGVYLTSEQKKHYSSLADHQRLGALIHGIGFEWRGGGRGYITLALELSLLVTLSALLLWMRGMRLAHQLGEGV
ncbi:hypothetical protein EON63_01245, partial [archaeon]